MSCTRRSTTRSRASGRASAGERLARSRSPKARARELLAGERSAQPPSHNAPSHSSTGSSAAEKSRYRASTTAWRFAASARAPADQRGRLRRLHRRRYADQQRLGRRALEPRVRRVLHTHAFLPPLAFELQDRCQFSCDSRFQRGPEREGTAHQLRQERTRVPRHPRVVMELVHAHDCGHLHPGPPQPPPRTPPVRCRLFLSGGPSGRRAGCPTPGPARRSARSPNLQSHARRAGARRTNRCHRAPRTSDRSALPRSVDRRRVPAAHAGLPKDTCSRSTGSAGNSHAPRTAPRASRIVTPSS